MLGKLAGGLRARRLSTGVYQSPVIAAAAAGHNTCVQLLEAAMKEIVPDTRLQQTSSAASGSKLSHKCVLA